MTGPESWELTPTPALSGLRMAPRVEWQWMVGDWQIGPQRELRGASNRSLTVKLTDPSDAGFRLFGNSTEAPEVQELVDDVWILRNGQCLLRGRVMDTSDDVGTTVHSSTFNVTDYRGVLDRRMIPPTGGGNSPTYNALATKPQEDIVWDDLIAVTQARTGGHLGLDKADDWPITGVDRVGIVFADGDSVWEQIRTLGAMANGFDIHIDENLRVHLYHPQRGSNLGAALDFGGAVRSLTRQVTTASYANAIRINGGQSDTVGPYTVTDEVADLGNSSVHPEGRWETTSSEQSVYELTALQDLAATKLAAASTLQPTYVFTMQAGAWMGPDHIWVGDTVQYTVRAGRLDVRNESARVQEISIALDQNDVETVTVTVGGPVYTLTRAVRELSRRLAVLARR